MILTKIKIKSTLILSLFLLILLSCNPQDQNHEGVQEWDIFEIELKGPSDGNPFMDIELSAEFFNAEAASIEVPGFYDGDGTYYIRFSPKSTGVWDYKTFSNNKMLAGITGSFKCIQSIGDNHGPIKVADTFSLKYADGTPFYSIGTTAYQWTSVKQSIQEKTIETLASAPFNKIRMCVFPKYYIYGSDTAPWQYPFKRENGENDYSQPNFDFFQNFDKRIQQLLDLGIQADVILFHPYDLEWGYYKMGDEMNERYVRYMIARISAYRNVWWSLANEWDKPETKTAINWEGIGTLLQKEDPHQRLRGIHNWYDTEDHFYDHSRPWISHASIQAAQFYNIPRWREKYQKPVLFDEMRYEGDVPRGWGNLSGPEMASYFWMTGLSGAYPTHGETYQNDSDDSTEVRWWAKGGTIMGNSIPSIAYFKEIIEQAPIQELSPQILIHGDSTNLENNVYILTNNRDYHLAYVADPGQTITLDLPELEGCQLEIIDTWNRKVIETRPLSGSKFEFTTADPYTAIRVICASDY